MVEWRPNLLYQFLAEVMLQMEVKIQCKIGPLFKHHQSNETRPIQCCRLLEARAEHPLVDWQVIQFLHLWRNASKATNNSKLNKQLKALGSRSQHQIQMTNLRPHRLPLGVASRPILRPDKEVLAFLPAVKVFHRAKRCTNPQTNIPPLLVSVFLTISVPQHNRPKLKRNHTILLLIRIHSRTLVSRCRRAVLHSLTIILRWSKIRISIWLSSWDSRKPAEERRSCKKKHLIHQILGTIQQCQLWP